MKLLICPFKYVVLFLLVFSLNACSGWIGENGLAHAKQTAKDFNQDLPYKGEYTRAYALLGEVHKEHYLFTPKNGQAPAQVSVRTQGKYVNQDAHFSSIGYDAKQQRWLGMSDQGSLLLIFFAQNEQGELKILKRFWPMKHASEKKFKDHLNQALTMQRPEPTFTDYKGWNLIYAGADAALNESLPFIGTYRQMHDENHKARMSIDEFTLGESTLDLSGKQYKKLSYHAGDLRWVGQSQEQYVVIFFKPQTSQDATLVASIAVYENLKYLYNSKPSDVLPRYWGTYQRVQTPQTPSN